MFASTLGVFLAGFILMLLSFAIIGGIVASATQDKEVAVSPNSLLHLQFNGAIVDRGTDFPFSGFDLGSFSPEKQLGLNDILANIEKAAYDQNITGILIDGNSLPASMATIEEIRNALLKFKENSDKFIVSYADVYGQGSYYLSSVADEVYLNPEGEVGFRGLAAQLTFFKGAFEKLGIEPVIIRHGKFKGAVEPFMLTKMSDANREQISAYVGQLWKQIIKGISLSRSITEAQLQVLADDLAIRNAKTALEHKFVDGLIHKDELLNMLKGKLEVDEKDDIEAISIDKYTNVFVKKDEEAKGLAKDKIAVIYAQGSIVTGNGKEGEIGSEKISKAIRKARRDDKVKAIVFRINSGGGSALASDIILREVKLAAAVKPVVASMGDLAASGGYYIACGADTIIASPNTITGSIGVFGLMFNTEYFMKDKLGITSDGFKTAKYADIGNMNRPMLTGERAIIQQSVDDIYNTFIAHVAQGRGMTTEAVDAIGQGRVWAGSNALELGLIDGFGGLQDAIDIAQEMAGLERYRITELPKEKSPMEQILEELGQAKMRIVYEELGLAAPYYKQLKSVLQTEGYRTELPFEISIK